jgi:hypothetical protein
VAVTQAALQADRRTVVLTTAAHADGNYTLTVSNVQDLASPSPNTVAAGTQGVYSFTSAPPPADAGTPADGGVDAGVPVDGGMAEALVPEGGAWAYSIGSSAPPADWADTLFDDSTWARGPAPLGFGEPEVRTTLSMGSAVTVYARYEFDLFVSPGAISKLVLRAQYDDGFVAYLNGTEVARRGVGAAQTFQTTATSHEATAFETLDLTAHKGLLGGGDNVLAIEVHNTSTSSSDLFLDAELSAVIVEGPPPTVTDLSPADGAQAVPTTAQISFHVRDSASGVDPNNIQLFVNGVLSDPTVGGTLNDRVVTFQPPSPLPSGAAVNVEVRAQNRNGIEMAPFFWSFTTVGGAGPGEVISILTGCGSCSQAGPGLLLPMALAWAFRRRRR